MIATFRALVRKDLLLFFSDRRAVLMTFVAPIVIASFFGYIFGGHAGAQASRVPVLVADGDGSAISREITARLRADKSLEVMPLSRAGMREAVRQGKVVAAITIPPGFGAEAGRAFFGPSKKPRIQVLYDPSRRTELSMVQGILAGHVMQAVSKEMFAGDSGREMVRGSIEELRQSDRLPGADKKALIDLLSSVERWNARAGSGGNQEGRVLQAGLGVPYETSEEAVAARAGLEYSAYGHSFAGMGVQFILFLGIEVGIGLLLQRRQGLWKRLRAAPLSRGVLLGSRAMSAAVISMLILLALFLFARLVFGVRVEGSMAGFLGVCAAFSIMTASFGLLIAALGKTPEATRGLAIFATLVMVMLGGAWVPTFVFPQWLQRLTILVPTRWAVDGLDAMTWRGLGFTAAAGPIGGLLLCALLFGALAVARFRWEADA